MPNELRLKVVRQDLGEANHTSGVLIMMNRKDERFRNKVNFDILGQFSCLPHLVQRRLEV